MPDLSPTCPYCSEPLGRSPKRKSRCKSCGEDVYVRSAQKILPSPYVTEEESRAVDLFQGMVNYGATPSLFEATAKELERATNRTPSASVTVLASVEHISGRNPEYARSIAWMAARFVAATGGDPREWLVKFKAAELQEFSGSPTIKGVKVRSAHCCESCAQIHGQKLLLTEAFEADLLPQPNCSREWYVIGFCNCDYAPWFKMPGEWTHA